MAIKCMIVDDEPIARSGLSEDLSRIEGFELISSVENAFQATDILNKTQIDLIFLDINMPGISGMEFLRMLKIKPMVILTTAYSQFALESYDFGVLDYLLKPTSPERLKQACDKATDLWLFKQQFEGNISRLNYFFIKSNGIEQKILFEDVLFIKAANNYIYIYTSTQKFLTYLSMKSIEKQLPASMFTRVHKSYIVAHNQIDKVNGNNIHIKSHEIPLSRNFLENFAKVIQSRKIGRKL